MLRGGRLVAMSDPTCALWYWSHGFMRVTLCDDENEAIDDGIAMQNHEQGSVAGIQWSDGNYIPVEQWEAFKAEDNRRFELMMEEAKAAATKPKPATRTVQAPFDDGWTVEVSVDAPSWLGRQR